MTSWLARLDEHTEVSVDGLLPGIYRFILMTPFLGDRYCRQATKWPLLPMRWCIGPDPGN